MIDAECVDFPIPPPNPSVPAPDPLPCNLTQLTFGTVFDGQPRLSPDGKTLVFTRFEADLSTPHVYTLNLAEVPYVPKRLTSVNYTFNPTWNPSGTRIAFVSYLLDSGSPNLLRSGFAADTRGPSACSGLRRPGDRVASKDRLKGA